MEDIKPPLTADVGHLMTSSDEISGIGDGVVKRIELLPEDEKLDKEKFLNLWQGQNRYIDQLEAKLKKAIQPDASRREHLLVVRLTTKEQELQELSNQIAELKASQAPSTAAMRNALLDPAVNLIVQKLKKELETTRNKLQETQEELSAWKFTPDSVTGKRLMAKCRQLLQENEEIGKMISAGRLAKLEGELSMQKALCEEMKKNQIEMDDFVKELDDEMEGMQSTIYLLQQQLKEANETISNLESKNIETSNVSNYPPDHIPPQSTNDTVDSAEACKNLEEELADINKSPKPSVINAKSGSITAHPESTNMGVNTTDQNFGEIAEYKNSVLSKKKLRPSNSKPKKSNARLLKRLQNRRKKKRTMLQAE